MSAFFTPGAQGSSVAAESAGSVPFAAPAVHDRRRFVKGNPGGPGNPHNRQIAGLRQQLLRVVTPADLEAIARRLIDLAAEGNVHAMKLFFAYLVGKPQPAEISEAPLVEDSVPESHAAPEPPPIPTHPIANPVPSVSARAVGTLSSPTLNGGKRLSKKQRRALRRNGTPSLPSVNGGNGETLGGGPPEDPLAALARQRDLLS